jgi:hypothetical protein
MDFKKNSGHKITLEAKYHPLDCDTPTAVVCHFCDVTVFQGSHAMAIFSENKDRTIHVCPRCASLIKELAPKGKMINIDLDVSKKPPKAGETIN